MTKMTFRKSVVVLGTIVLTAATTLTAALQPKARTAATVPGAAAARAKARGAMDRGVRYLRSKQLPDGSWERYPGITALAVLALLRAGVPARDAAVERAAGFLVAQAKPNGAIYTDALGPAQALPNYNTALSMTALHAAGSARYHETNTKAQRYLETSQYDEGEGVSPGDATYGGMGYGRSPDNPDLSNLQQSLEALRETGYPQHGDAFKKAIAYLQRCQNRNESNDQSWSGNDGGFIYAARGESKADEYTKQPHSSYGSMTYAGLKSYLYCGVSKSDPRAQAAYAWLRAHYSVKDNPRMRDDGLYYYYHTMSKTLAVYGNKSIVDTGGRRHYWAVDLINELASRQARDGSWVNRNRRWQENDPQLVTSYAMISLANCTRGL